MNYWLLKSEPSTFSIDDLMNRPDRREHWDGVRNYQARNHLRAMRSGDLAFFYHSSCAQPGIVGTMRIVREAYPDPSALDPASPYHDPRASADDPRWFMVDVEYQQRIDPPIGLNELRSHPELEGLIILRRGNRLSVTPIEAEEWRFILSLASRRT
ncbi:MAG: EVE domain-containing protein [Gammaproteobacteria bacterium]|jgi:predicted RNA-binding protein with PUA-like domain|nr:EVE domain-containing protein [Gammaproteobacteria bacterium]